MPDVATVSTRDLRRRLGHICRTSSQCLHIPVTLSCDCMSEGGEKDGGHSDKDHNEKKIKEKDGGHSDKDHNGKKIKKTSSRRKITAHLHHLDPSRRMVPLPLQMEGVVVQPPFTEGVVHQMEGVNA